MEWSIRAEQKLNELLQKTPVSYQEQMKEGARREAEQLASEKNRNFIDVDEIISGFILATAAHEREFLKKRLEACGVKWQKYNELFRQ